MQIIPTVAWKLTGKEDEPLDARLLPLLQAIEATSALSAAVVKCGISYRAGWGLLREYRQKLSMPLVSFERGQGATLTELGVQLVRAHASAERRLERMHPEFSIDVPDV